MVKNEKLTILRFLIEQNNASFTIRELAIQRNINYKSAYQVIEKLEKEQAITVTKKGNTKLCQFNQTLTPSTYLIEKKRQEEIATHKNISLLYTELQKVPTQCICLLFGSYAKQKQTKHSDIDLLVISENSSIIKKHLTWIPKRLHITSIDYKEFSEMLTSKTFNVVNEALKNNIILLGIEDYYRFLSNARQTEN